MRSIASLNTVVRRKIPVLARNETSAVQSVTTQCTYSLSTVMKEVKTSWTCGSDPQSRICMQVEKHVGKQ
jgi:hypothetical protein